MVRLPTFEIRSSEEISDFVRGCTLFGSGGGGSPDYGIRILTKALEEGNKIIITDPSQIPDNDWTTCAYGMGSIAPRTPKILSEIKELGLNEVRVDYKLAEAIRGLEEYSKLKISTIVSLELGGANTPDPVATAAHSGLSVVDGDYAGGRAVPEIIQTTPHLAGKKMIPLVSADEWGNTAILTRAVNNLVAEKIGKLISILAYGNLAGNATYLIQGSEMKKLVVPGSLSRALSAGKILRELKSAKKIDFNSFAKSLGGYYLFRGQVVSKDEEDRDGYYWGSTTLKGLDDFHNHFLKIWFKNENHFSWIDDRPYVMSPDIITAIDLDTMEPTINPRIKVGKSLAVFGFKANPRFRGQEGLNVLGPHHFGFETRYIPIEEIAKEG